MIGFPIEFKSFYRLHLAPFRSGREQAALLRVRGHLEHGVVEPQQHGGVGQLEAEGVTHQDGHHDRERKGAEQSRSKTRLLIRLPPGDQKLMFSTCLRMILASP